jgi:hypothetical protein
MHAITVMPGYMQGSGDVPMADGFFPGLAVRATVTAD